MESLGSRSNPIIIDDLEERPTKRLRRKECTRSYGKGTSFSPLHLSNADVKLPTDEEFQEILCRLQHFWDRQTRSTEEEVAWRMVYNDGWRPTGDFSSISFFANNVKRGVSSWMYSQRKHAEEMSKRFKK